MTGDPLTLPDDPSTSGSPTMPPSLPRELAELAAARAVAAKALDDCTDKLIRAVAAELEAGRDVNIKALAEASNLSRQTVYSRLDELGVQR